MPLPDTAKMSTCCKDHMHVEWAEYKLSNQAKEVPVCSYGVGGSRDVPIAAMGSISRCISEWRKLAKETVQLSVDRNRPISINEVTIGADGQAILYPERRIAVDETESIASSSTQGPPGSAAAAAAAAARGKPPQTGEAVFMGGIEQTSNYMLDHLKRLCEKSLTDGNTKVLYLTLASAALIASQLNMYKQALKQPNSIGMTDTLGRCTEVVELMTQHLINYHCDTLHSSLLHDAYSHDWLHQKGYHEGERFSLCIQTWSFYLQNVRSDLWRYTTPRIAESILASVFTDTLSLLVTRYFQIEVSDMRLIQYRADIVAIMTIVASLLPSLIASPNDFFNARLHETPAFSIHRRTNLLVKIAALKCAPISSIARVFHNGVNLRKRNVSSKKNQPIHIKTTPEWLTLLNPVLFPPKVLSLADLPKPNATYLCLLTAASKPFCHPNLVLRGLLINNYLGAKTLINGLQEAPGHVDGGSACKGPLCLPHLCTPPLGPHTAYAAIVQVLFQCVPWSPILTTTMCPGIKASGLWDSLDRTQVWNLQRPPWHHALVQLVSQHVAGVVAEVVRSIPTEPPGKPAHPSQLSVRLEHHLSAWTMQMLTGVESIAGMMPVPLLHVANAINTVLPPTIKPVGGHVITQLVASALYSLVNSRSTIDQFGEIGPITDNQWDMMVAVGERLCSLHDGNYDSHLMQLTKILLNQLRNEEEEPLVDNLDDYIDEEVIDSVYSSLTNQMLSNTQGQHALTAVWECLKRNMEWIGDALGIQSILPVNPNSQKFTPRPGLSMPPKPLIYNPLHYYNKILYTKLDQDRLIGFEGNWEAILRGDLWLPTKTVVELIRQRPEMKDDAILTEADTKAVEKLKLHVAVEEI